MKDPRIALELLRRKRGVMTPESGAKDSNKEKPQTARKKEQANKERNDLFKVIRRLLDERHDMMLGHLLYLAANDLKHISDVDLLDKLEDLSLVERETKLCCGAISYTNAIRCTLPKNHKSALHVNTERSLMWRER